jgi:hypothetical protein
MDDDFVVDLQLSLLAFNIKKEVCGVSNGFISFFKKYEKKSHNMLSMTLRPRSKNLLLVQEHGVTIVEEYKKQSLFPMLLKCHQILLPMVELELW